MSQMHRRQRYREILFVVDTCQAGSLANHIVAPNVVSVGSARVGENSYAQNLDLDVGLATGGCGGGWHWLAETPPPAAFPSPPPSLGG